MHPFFSKDQYGQKYQPIFEGRNQSRHHQNALEDLEHVVGRVRGSSNFLENTDLTTIRGVRDDLSAAIKSTGEAKELADYVLQQIIDRQESADSEMATTSAAMSELDQFIELLCPEIRTTFAQERAKLLDQYTSLVSQHQTTRDLNQNQAAEITALRASIQNPANSKGGPTLEDVLDEIRRSHESQKESRINSSQTSGLRADLEVANINLQMAETTSANKDIELNELRPYKSKYDQAAQEVAKIQKIRDEYITECRVSQETIRRIELERDHNDTKAIEALKDKKIAEDKLNDSIQEYKEAVARELSIKEELEKITKRSEVIHREHGDQKVRISSLTQEVGIQNGVIADREAEISTLNDAAKKTRKEIENLRTKSAEAENELSTKTVRESELISQATNRELRITRLLDSVKDKEKEIQEKQQTIDDLQNYANNPQNFKDKNAAWLDKVELEKYRTLSGDRLKDLTIVRKSNVQLEALNEQQGRDISILTGQNQNLRIEIDNLKTKILDMKKLQQATQSELDKTKQDRTSLKNDVNRLTNELKRSSEEVKSTAAEKDQSTSKLQSQISILEKELEGEKSSLERAEKNRKALEEDQRSLRSDFAACRAQQEKLVDQETTLQDTIKRLRAANEVLSENMRTANESNIALTTNNSQLTSNLLLRTTERDTVNRKILEADKRSQDLINRNQQLEQDLAVSELNLETEKNIKLENERKHSTIEADKNKLQMDYNSSLEYLRTLETNKNQVEELYREASIENSKLTKSNATLKAKITSLDKFILDQKQKLVLKDQQLTSMQNKVKEAEIDAERSTARAVQAANTSTEQARREIESKNKEMADLSKRWEAHLEAEQTKLNSLWETHFDTEREKLNADWEKEVKKEQEKLKQKADECQKLQEYKNSAIKEYSDLETRANQAKKNYQADYAERKRKLNDRITDLENTIESRNHRINTMEKTEKSIEEAHSKVSQNVTSLTVSVMNLTAQVQDLTLRVSDKETEITKLTAKYEKAVIDLHTANNERDFAQDEARGKASIDQEKYLALVKKYDSLAGQIESNRATAAASQASMKKTHDQLVEEMKKTHNQLIEEMKASLRAKNKARDEWYHKYVDKRSELDDLRSLYQAEVEKSHAVVGDSTIARISPIGVDVLMANNESNVQRAFREPSPTEVGDDEILPRMVSPDLDVPINFDDAAEDFQQPETPQTPIISSARMENSIPDSQAPTVGNTSSSVGNQVSPSPYEVESANTETAIPTEAIDDNMDTVMSTVEPGSSSALTTADMQQSGLAQLNPLSRESTANSSTSLTEKFAINKIDFLVSGSPMAGIRTSDVHSDIRMKLEDMFTRQWEKCKQRHTWFHPSDTLRCVDVRLRKINTSKAPIPKDVDTACAHCIKSGTLCLINQRKSTPVIVPLPVNMRAAGATPKDVGYYIKQTM